MTATVERRLTHDDIREWDGYELGSWMGVLIDGHHDDDTAVAYMWREMLEHEYASESTIDPPVRCWVRKVPTSEGCQYIYATKPGRGAHAVTRVEVRSRWSYRCDLAGCENHYVPGGASMGFPVENFIDPPGNRQDERYVYMCRRHARDFDERLDAARKAALAKYYAERADASV